MARWIRGTGFGVVGLAAGLASQMLSAQAFGLPASDPVGIGRSGTGVAFGQSLEAAALNPALLVTLRDRASVFLSMGLEMQCSQITTSTVPTLWSTDRNRVLPAFGAAWRVNDDLAFGIKLDEPYLRHGAFTNESSLRFQQRAIKLGTNRLELQGAWALNPNWSVGVGLGVTRVRYSSQVVLRVDLPGDTSLPLSDANESRALMELPLVQSGEATATTYSLGLRWAINPRWTIGGSYQSAIRATPKMAAGATSEAPTYIGLDGYGTPETGSPVLGPQMMNAMFSAAGSGEIVLPARASIGVRQRYNQLLTWEADLRYVAGASFKLPSQPVLLPPSGVVASPGVNRHPRNGYGLSAALEMTFNKSWTARLGMEHMSGFFDGSTTEPFVGGAPTSGFSCGATYKGMGGEWSLGYQYRQSKDENTQRLNPAWNSKAGYSNSGGNATAVEGMGHLMSIGFKKAF